MKIDNIYIDANLSEAERLLKEDKNISPALASIINVLPNNWTPTNLTGI